MKNHRAYPAPRSLALLVPLSLVACTTNPSSTFVAPETAYRSEYVSIPAPAGHLLAGTLTIPADAPKGVPAVILIHGSGRNDRDQTLSAEYRPFSQIADVLSRQGIAVLRYDKRGVAESTGDYGSATTADFADDARSAVAYLRTREEVDPKRVALVGHSEGGLIAPMVAATDPEIAGVALLATSSRPGRAVLEYQATKHAEAEPEIPVAEREEAAARLLAEFVARADGAWLRYFLDYDPIPAARQIGAPVLIVQGAKDSQVAAEQAEELAAAIQSGGNPAVCVRILPEFGHLFVHDELDRPVTTMAQEVVDVIAEWLVFVLQYPRAGLPTSEGVPWSLTRWEC